MQKQWRAEKRIRVTQPVERVFDYLSRWQQVAEWDASVVAAQALDAGPPQVGSRFRLVLRLAGRRVPMTYTLTAMEPPRRLTLAGRGDRFRVVDEIRLAGAGPDTRIDYRASVRFEPPLGPWAHHLGAWLFDAYGARAMSRLQAMLSPTPRPPRLTTLTRLADGAVLPGLIGFTRLGYILGKRRRPVASALYRGKTMVLTGGTSGIGRAAARDLFARGADLVVVGRDREKLDALAASLSSNGDGGTIATEVADLSLLAEVRDLARRLRRRCPRIHVLINNAGALFNQYAETSEGIERTLATDLASPYLLTRLLMPTLADTAGARIVNVASGGMYTQAMRAEMIPPTAEGYDGPTAYARAKRGLVIVSRHWARELAPAGLSVHCMHPGWVDTPGLAASLPAFHRQVSRALRTPRQGADTIVWLAASPDAHRSSGEFWLDRKIRRRHVFRHTRTDPAEQQRLMRSLDRLTGLESPEG